MFMVLTPDGSGFSCLEFEDAVSFADSLAKDLDIDVVVIDESTLEVVYTARE